MSEEHHSNQTRSEETVTPLGVVKVVVVLFIGVGALLAALTVLGMFAWLSLWSLLLKLAAVTAILIATILLISWLMKGRH